MTMIRLKSAALASALLLMLALPAYACGCCGGGAAQTGQKAGGCMGGMSGMSGDSQSKKPMCGMGSMSMTQQQSDDAMMGAGGMDHSKMTTGAVNPPAASPQSVAPEAQTSPAAWDVDAAFAKAMIPHHQGAIEMATLYLKSGRNAEMRKLAEDILKAQDREIAFLNGWLAGAAK